MARRHAGGHQGASGYHGLIAAWVGLACLALVAFVFVWDAPKTAQAPRVAGRIELEPAPAPISPVQEQAAAEAVTGQIHAEAPIDEGAAAAAETRELFAALEQDVTVAAGPDHTEARDESPTSTQGAARQTPAAPLSIAESSAEPVASTMPEPSRKPAATAEPASQAAFEPRDEAPSPDEERSETPERPPMAIVKGDPARKVDMSRQIAVAGPDPSIASDAGIAEDALPLLAATTAHEPGSITQVLDRRLEDGTRDTAPEPTGGELRILRDSTWQEDSGPVDDTADRSSPDAHSAPDQAQGHTASPGEPNWQRYAMAFDVPSNKPLIAVVITGLGRSSAVTEAAIQSLPPEVALSFDPNAPELDSWLKQAQAAGHEVLLDLRFLATDPSDAGGARDTLVASLEPEENVQRLLDLLERAERKVGVSGRISPEFLVAGDNLELIFQLLADQGLLFLDSSPEDDLPSGLAAPADLTRVRSGIRLDDGLATRGRVAEGLGRAEELALTEGSSVAVGQPYPVTLEILESWLLSLEDRGFTLVPVTAIAAGQKDGKAS